MKYYTNMNSVFIEFNNDDFDSFTNRIKRLMKFNNITVEYICKYLFIEPRTYYRLMKNKEGWTDEKINALANILGVSTYYLLYGNEDIESIDKNVVSKQNAEAAVVVLHKYLESLPKEQSRITLKELSGKLLDYALDLK